MLSKIKLVLLRIYRYEFWPFWFFYILAYFYGIYLALRSGSLLYFLRVNPGMPYSGAMGIDKQLILNQLPDNYIPGTLFLNCFTNRSSLLIDLQSKAMEFPLIVKPNNGERGKNVELVNNEHELEEQCLLLQENIIIQSYINNQNEMGVLFYKCPKTGKGVISSVVLKKFLTVTGNGKESLGQLISKHDRGKGRLEYLKKKHHEDWLNIPSFGEKILLEPIGNHNRGTSFLNGNHLINDKLVKVFEQIAKRIDGFDYGRFDIKFNNLTDLYKGKNIHILELNGVNSEPAHIYQPGYGILNAYSCIFKHMKIIYSIAKKKKKSPTIGIFYFINLTQNHLKSNRIKVETKISSKIEPV